MAQTRSARPAGSAPRRITQEDAQRVLADPAVAQAVLGADAEPIDAEDAGTAEEVIELVRARASAVVRTGTARPRVRSRRTVSELPSRRGPHAKPASQVVRSEPTRSTPRPQVRSSLARDDGSVARRGPRARRTVDVTRERAEAAAAASAKQPSGKGKPIPRLLAFWHKSHHPRLDGRDAKFRRQRVAVGKLVGAELHQVTDAYVWAYFMAGSARNELRSWADTPQDIPALWNGFVDHPEAALGHWYGHKVPGRPDARQIMDSLQDVLEAWTLAFSHGFRAGFPVFIRRKERDPVFGSPSARHVARNTVELMPQFFDLGPESQATILLHEMGHWAISMTNPRDERHNLCDGGWNRKENMCYHAGKDDLRSEDQLLRGDNPRTLAESFDNGNTGAGKTARNNIDNYVAFMWNRFVDRGESVLYVPPAGSRRPTTAPVGKGKPID